MRSPAGKLRGLAAFALAMTLAAAAAAQLLPAPESTHSIGTLGATIPADTWERRTISADMGPDQFVRVDRDYYMVAFEMFDLYQERTDFLEALDLFSDGVSARLGEVSVEPSTGYTRSAELTRATRRFSGTISGLQLGYQVDLVSAGDGVGYLTLSWAALSDFERLQEQLDSTMAGMTLPGPDSDWARRATPSAHSFEFGERSVEITFRDSVFSPAESAPGRRYSLSAGGGDIGLHLFVAEHDDDLEAVLDLVKRAAVDDSGYEELARTDLETPLGPGRQLLLREEGDPPTDLALAVIGLGDDRWVDFRMVSENRTGHRPDLWEALIGSLQVHTRTVGAFPIVETPAENLPHYLGEAARGLLEASRLLASEQAEVLALREGGDVLIREGRRLRAVSAGEPGEESGTASSEVLYQSDDYLPGLIVPWGERLLVIGTDSEVSTVTGGRLEPAGFETDLAAADGDELLLARNGVREPLLGLADLPAAGPARVLLRDAAGEERPLAELPGERVVALARRPGGPALVAAAPDALLSPAAEGASTRLLRLAGGRGKPVEIARWERVDRIEPGPDGWLVTGLPADGREGVHRVADDGGSELLLGGDAIGLALTGGEVVFSSRKCLEPSDSYHRNCVYRTPLDLAAELGGRFQPFTRRTVDEIAARVLPASEDGRPPAFPATREAIAALVEAARASARELTGAELPLSAAGVDDLLTRLTWNPELSDVGVLLLSAMLTESLLRDGAVWQPSAEPSAPARGGEDLEIESAFAVGAHPVAVVLGTLYDEEGWYQPASSVAERARGRTIVLGVDRGAVRERVRADAVAGLADLLASGPAPRLIAALEERPDNLHLRQVVYGHLAAAGRRAELVEVAGAFAAREAADGIDLVAWIAARMAGEPSAAEMAGVIADSRAAIERAPDQAGLYLVLGAAYERSTEPDRLELARACFRKAGEIAGWGRLVTDSQEALERVEAALEQVAAAEPGR